MPGGYGGKSIGYADGGSTIDYHCHKGTAGGSGGAGGGGGGGAGGHAGEAYGFMFLCNRTVSGYDVISDLEKCGFKVDQHYLDSRDGFASTTAAQNGTKGTNGNPGVWQSSNDTSADQDAVISSQGGHYGAFGAGMGGTTGTAKSYILEKTTTF